jgi:tetratricopeptide (TPR) repeat protein
LEYYQKALKINDKIGNKNGSADSLIGIGSILYFKGKYDQALAHFQKSLKIAEETGDKRRIAKCSHNIGSIYNDAGKYDQAMEYYQKALKINEELGDKSGIATSLNTVGNIYYFLGKYDLVLEYSQKSLKIFEEIGDSSGSADSLNNMGVIYQILGKYDQALEYYLKSLKKYEEIRNKSSIADCFSNIGNLYYGLGKYNQALEYYHKSLKIKEDIGEKSSIAIANTISNMGEIYRTLSKFDKALEYQQKALKIREENGEKTGIANSINNIGEIYRTINKYDQALKYYQKSLQIKEEIGDKSGISSSLSNIGLIYLKLQKFAEGEKYLKQSLNIAKEIKDLTQIMDIYNNFSELFETQGDFKKAFEYYKLYFEVYKNVFNEKSDKQINELQAKYEAEKRAKEIELLKKNNELMKQREEVQKIKLQKQMLLRDSFFVGFILIAIIFGLLFKKYLYFFAFWKKEKYIGRYRLLDIIGAGGMSVVYKAHSIKEKTEKVAVKILKEEFSKDDSIIKRFKQEALIIDKLDHPNIVKVFERGEDKNRLFMAMEYLDGETLAEKIAQESPIALPVCVHIMSQLADALAQIHAHKIIHRDLKPSNVILLDREGDSHFVKLLDFGLARTRFQSTLTKTGELLGTIGYMAPEQLLDQDVTAASDIYSLGVIFYEMVCGRRAFTADNEIQIIKHILDEMPVSPVAVRPEIPAAINRLILQMLAKDPGRRPTLADFREQLHLLGRNGLPEQEKSHD